MATNYERGRSFEYSVMNNLKRLGYTCMRSYASRTPADVWAVKCGRVAFIQAKLHGKISKAEWDSFFAYCQSAGAVPIIAKRPDGKTRGVEFYLVRNRRGVGARPWVMVTPTDWGTWED